MAIRWPWRREAKRSRLVSIGDPFLAQMLGYNDGLLPAVNEVLAMNLSSVFRAVSLVAGSIATLPLRTFVTDSVTGLRSPIGSFLDNPGPMVNGKLMFTSFDIKEMTMLHMLLHGNAFLQHVFNNAGAISGINPIHPLAVGIELDPSVPGGKLFRATLLDGTTKEFDATTMTHIPGLTFDGIRGISPIGHARTTFGASLAADRAAAKAFQNGAMISGLVTPDDDLDPDEAKAIKKDLTGRVTGPENAGEVVVINRKLNFSPWQMTAADAQFLESREFQVEEVGRWFGIPPHLLGVTEKATSWGQGIAEQNRGLARYTLKPWTSRIDERLSLIVPVGKTVEFDYSEFVASSPEQLSTMLIAEVTGQLRTPNEARKVLNLPPVDGGDVLRGPVKESTTPAAALPAVPAPPTTTPGGGA
jgi:HK97 family phage portal protein